MNHLSTSLAAPPRFRFSTDALWCCVKLYALLLVAYCSSNWLTSFRHDVGIWRFAWEDAIPYVPAMFIPYLAMNTFFQAAPFLCADNRERRVFARRMAGAILVATVCFLLFPLTNSFARPPQAGFWGMALEGFMSFDMPYNMLPSLHVAFLTILAEFYARHFSGIWRWALLSGLGLSAASTLLTKQHHLVDVIAGLLLGLLLLWGIGGTRSSSSR